MKKGIKAFATAALSLAVVLLTVAETAAVSYGDNVITDPFSSERPAYDVNLDGVFDIKDLIRLKKYASGKPVTVDLSVFSAAAEQTLENWTVNLNSWRDVKSTLTNNNSIVAETKDGLMHDVAQNSFIYVDDDKHTNQLYAGVDFTDTINADDGDGFIFYVKTESANTILPMLIVNDPRLTYNPDMALKVGSEYFYRTMGGNWKKATVSETGHSTLPQYFGVVSFDSAFEGYVKIPFSSLSNDNSNVSRLDSENNILKFLCKFKGLGGKYGKAVIGPFYIYSEDGVASASQTMVFFKRAIIGS